MSTPKQYVVTYELENVDYDGVIRQYENTVVSLNVKSRITARGALLTQGIPVRMVHDVRPYETAESAPEDITQYAVRWVSDSGEIATYECPDQADAEDFLRHLQKARTHPGANPRIVTRTISPWKDPMQ